ncbi:glucose dehydrogenase [FAD, quinone]-like [Schistocerca nitens]|uniref:glucose dehydrogenase [FAD, quinone]-like n=1 Tax=Schistocerca nitens TaxID=7011 RepID=UPI0021189808|nr:glucose dehydrogenase [FAD, quinone]-like [Schistocerca nitens]
MRVVEPEQAGGGRNPRAPRRARGKTAEGAGVIVRQRQPVGGDRGGGGAGGRCGWRRARAAPAAAPRVTHSSLHPGSGARLQSGPSAATGYVEWHAPDRPDALLLPEYDFVVVGAGSAGSVVAARLSEVAGWTVLLLEAGMDESVLTDIPIFVGYFQLTNYNWGYRVQPQQGACLAMRDRRCEWPRGKALGGSSVINYMIYTRGHPGDYDSWRDMGNPGWGYRDVLPYFKKSENARRLRTKDAGFHGEDGPLDVETPTFRTPLVEAFLDAAAEAGYPSRRDYNGARHDVFGYVQSNTRRGSRCSANKAFVRPAAQRPNLHVALHAHVAGVDVEAGRAAAVRFLRGGRMLRVRARKEVILSAGALNTPQLLMLSGIGPADHLRSLGIPVVVDAPGVGENLQEHVTYLGLTFLVNDSVAFVESRMQQPALILQYLLNGTGPLTVPGGVEAVGYVHTPLDDDPYGRPDVELLYASGSLNSDGGGALRKGFGISDEFYERMYRSVDNRDSWTIWPLLMHPRSRGRVRLRTANPLHWPLFEGNFFSDERDLRVLVAGIREALRIAGKPPLQRFASRLHATPVPGCEHLGGGGGGGGEEPDEYWECAARRLSGTLHHQSGTCKMGPASDAAAVVDARLRVRGVAALRVADASVMPTVPTAHTNAPTYMIGEKAADMVKQDWGAIPAPETTSAQPVTAARARQP